MVSKARLDLPEPERPVTTMSLSRGISTDMFLRLCTRAPRTATVVRRWGRPSSFVVCLASLAASLLELIRHFSHVDERQLLHQDVALLRELHGRRDLADEPPIGE